MTDRFLAGEDDDEEGDDEERQPMRLKSTAHVYATSSTEVKHVTRVQDVTDSSDEDAEGPDEYDMTDRFLAAEDDDEEGDDEEREGDNAEVKEVKRRRRARKRSREQQLDEDDYQLLQEAVSLFAPVLPRMQRQAALHAFWCDDGEEREGDTAEVKEVKRRCRARKRSREQQPDEYDYQLLQEAVSPMESRILRACMHSLRAK